MCNVIFYGINIFFGFLYEIKNKKVFGDDYLQRGQNEINKIFNVTQD